jgi:ribosomal protein S18 acetylase RimI-like enzyme
MAGGSATTVIRKVCGPHGPDADLVRAMARVFVEARRERLQFLIDLHDEHEDRQYLSGVVMPNNEMHVAEAGGQVVGFIAFAGGWVNHLYVAPPFQGRGVGTRLLALAKAAGPALQLWAFEANTPAIAFYARQGFRVVERTDGAANEARRPDVRMEWSARAGEGMSGE